MKRALFAAAALTALAAASPAFAQLDPTARALGATALRGNASNTFTATQAIALSGCDDTSGPILSLSAGTNNVRFTCFKSTGPLVLEGGFSGQNVLNVRSPNVNGEGAIGYMGADPNYTNAFFTGAISGTTLTVSATALGTIAIGQAVGGTNVTNGTVIVSGSGTTWTVNKSQTVSSTAMVGYKLFEHGALFWGGVDQPIFGLEASTFDGTSNALIPPPGFGIYATGGVDPTGGAANTCTVTSGSANFTCTANIGGSNGNLVFGGSFNKTYGLTQLPSASGIPAGTTLVSGAGTTSGVLSNAATASVSNEVLVFTNPVYGQRRWLYSSPTGQVFFQKWNAGSAVAFDRQTGNFGIGTDTPSQPLEVNGVAQFDVAVIHKQQTGGNCYDYATPTTGTTYTMPDNKCVAILEEAGALASLTLKLPATPIDGQISTFTTRYPIAAATFSANSGQVLRASTTPISLAAGQSMAFIYNANTVWYPLNSPGTVTLYSAAGLALPTCNAGSKGLDLVAIDATSPTFLGTYTSGGSTVAKVICNASNWVTY